jgi:hypothetical protein
VEAQTQAVPNRVKKHETMPHIPKQNSASANFYARCKNPSALEGKRGVDRPKRTGLQLLKAEGLSGVFAWCRPCCCAKAFAIL